MVARVQHAGHFAAWLGMVAVNPWRRARANSRGVGAFHVVELPLLVCTSGGRRARVGGSEDGCPKVSLKSQPGLHYRAWPGSKRSSTFQMVHKTLQHSMRTATLWEGDMRQPEPELEAERLSS